MTVGMSGCRVRSASSQTSSSVVNTSVLVSRSTRCSGPAARDRCPAISAMSRSWLPGIAAQGASSTFSRSLNSSHSTGRAVVGEITGEQDEVRLARHQIDLGEGRREPLAAPCVHPSDVDVRELCDHVRHPPSLTPPGETGWSTRWRAATTEGCASRTSRSRSSRAWCRSSSRSGRSSRSVRSRSTGGTTPRFASATTSPSGSRAPRLRAADRQGTPMAARARPGAAATDPRPIAKGRPGCGFPAPWSIYGGSRVSLPPSSA